MQIGDKVYLKDNPQKKGLLKKKIVKNNRVYWSVKFDNGIPIIPESYLDVYQEEKVYDLPTLIENNLFNSIADVRREITKIRLNGNLNDMLYSMDATNTDFYAHQFKPVMKIINSASNSVLIADEVGLGKTIEAGLIWTELKQRYNFKHLLIVCPGILREKWKSELKTKMGVKADIVNAKELINISQTEDEFALICSRQGLLTRTKSERNIEGSRDRGNEVHQLFQDLADKGEKIFDLLIVDEAHYFRNPETQTYKIGKYLREVSEYAVFLSATPVQNKSEDLLSLVSILDPINFQREYIRNSFDDILRINKPLIKLRDGLLSDKLDKKNILSLIKDVHNKDILGLFNNSKQLAILEKEISKTEELTSERLHHFAYEIDSINSLGYIINRTRKRDIQENRVIREAIPEEISMTKEENKIFDAISEIIRKYANQVGNEHLAKFLLCMPQRMMSSCIYASIDLWKKRSNSISYEDEDNEDTIEKIEITDFMANIYDEVSKIKDLTNLFRHDTKYQRLLEVLKNIEKKYPEEKVVLFSSFIPTLEYLQNRLQKDGIESSLISGKIKNKTDILDQFQNNPKIKILLASEVGSEGVDLQFCRLLVNYDLPWNPMRVEQRIGRLDRIGQKNKKILIWNMFHDTTIDKRIYEKLYQKFDICTGALGDFEKILGETFKNLSLELLLLSPEEQDKQIEQTRSAIKNLEEENNRLEEKASELTAYGDYVLKEIQKNKDEENIIKPSDISNYVVDTLHKLYQNVTISPTNIENNYEVVLDSLFRVEFEDYCLANNIGVNNLLLRGSGSIICSFTNKVVFSKNPKKEIINQFHPLIKFLRYKDKDENMAPTTAIKVENSKNKGFYIIGVSLMSANGLTSYEKLIYSGKNILTGKYISEDNAKKILLEAIDKGHYWADRSRLSYLDLGNEASDIMIKNLDVYENTVRDIYNKNYDKIEMQKTTLERHLKLKQTQLEEQKQKYIENNNERMIPAAEGKFAILKQKIDDRLVRIEQNKEIYPDKTDICMVLIKAE